MRLNTRRPRAHPLSHPLPAEHGSRGTGAPRSTAKRRPRSGSHAPATSSTAVPIDFCDPPSTAVEDPPILMDSQENVASDDKEALAATWSRCHAAAALVGLLEVALTRGDPADKPGATTPTGPGRQRDPDLPSEQRHLSPSSSLLTPLKGHRPPLGPASSSISSRLDAADRCALLCRELEAALAGSSLGAPALPLVPHGGSTDSSSEGKDPCSPPSRPPRPHSCFCHAGIQDRNEGSVDDDDLSLALRRYMEDREQRVSRLLPRRTAGSSLSLRDATGPPLIREATAMVSGGDGGDLTAAADGEEVSALLRLLEGARALRRGQTAILQVARGAVALPLPFPQD